MEGEYVEELIEVLICDCSFGYFVSFVLDHPVSVDEIVFVESFGQLETFFDVYWDVCFASELKDFESKYELLVFLGTLTGSMFTF